MRQYYIHDGKDQKGPFTFDQLKGLNISKSTSLWYEGLENWTTAGNVDELKVLFNNTAPPPFEKPPVSPPPIPKIAKQKTIITNSKKKSKTWKILLWLIIPLLIIGVIFIVLNKTNVGGGSGPGTYQEKIMSIEDTEKANPAQYLEASGTYKETFWGGKFKIEGTVTNNATVAKYKDVVVEVVFYTETDTELQRERYVIYDYFPPHETKNFELKVEIPSGAKKLGWKAVDAKPY
jgi:hypothetical protein